MRDLQRHANQRHLEEQRIAREHAQSTAKAEATLQEQTTAAEKKYNDTKQELQKQHELLTEQSETQYHTTRDATQAEYRQLRDHANSKYDTTLREASEGEKQAVWQAQAVFDATKNNPREALEATQQQLASRQRELEQLTADAQEILRMRRLWRDEFVRRAAIEPTDKPTNSTKPEGIEQAKQEVANRLEAARQCVSQLQANRLSQLFEGYTPVGIFSAILLVSLLLAGFAVGWPQWPLWLASGLIVSLLIGGVGGWAMRRRLGSWASDSYQQFATVESATRGAIDLAANVARTESRQDAEQLVATRDRDIAEAKATARQATSDIESWKEGAMADANREYPERLATLKQQFEQDLSTKQAQHHEAMASVTAEYEITKRTAAETHSTSVALADNSQAEQWTAMRQAWLEGFNEVREAFDQMNQRCDRLFPDWNRTNYSEWPKPSEPTEAIQFGDATLDLEKVKHALSPNAELRPEIARLNIPTLVDLHEQPSLVASAEGEGRAAAVQLLETLMICYLTAMPPGKVRFTIFDPVSLGESFSSFMHLADFDEGLINGRIWSESRDIDEQLSRLTAYMETILQKYLRNEYATIHEYNAHAGEVAEPFQILAVANFPHGFTDTAAKRLLSLAAGGPRCGVYVLLSHDRKQRLPNDFELDDLLAPTVHLDWQASEQQFAWRYPAFERLPLALAKPIANDAQVALIKQAGQQAKDSIRVEVPFDVVAPELDERWTKSCDRELSIPVGRAGANRLHHVRLGKGTAQHLLVAGKTGSGKSTFLHALVTSGALHFSPDELRFYLVDFKKGVEFKSYATHSLPHAEVVAIESEREFGLSVLARLDDVLRRRGEQFRAAGVQSLADYRADHPGESMPRLLLVIDEFQELFVEDDKLAQEAGLLLDRLVRQGRAFGIHVLLGSQTLSGAYSLARSTLGQMAVRVALQCSESDAHLILSDERNQAARFLSRPGEAIYNDQNGLVAANQPFQVVWLPDRQRALHLAEINALRIDRGLPEQRPIVFEGNAPASPETNAALMAVLGSSEQQPSTGDGAPHTAAPATAWLGSAVAIKPPTSVTFAPHGGSNLLVVGQQPAAALGVMTTAVVSLVATQSTASHSLPTFTILDGSRPDDVGEGVWIKLADALGEQAELIAQRDVPQALSQLAEELARRDETGDETAPPCYLVIFNASRFRDLRKSEDDFSFSMDNDKPPVPDKQLAEILKNGPQWGMHTLVWCDGHNAVTRLFDRLAMREFETRIAFQMSAADSSNLLDTPAASQLSPHRALLYNDETGEAEKFRPYGPPTDEWIATVATLLERRASLDHQ